MKNKCCCLLLALMILLSACSQSTQVEDTSVPAADAAALTVDETYSAFPIFQDDTGREIRIGISRDQFAELFGESIENDWLTTIRQADLTVLATDDTIVCLYLGGTWHTIDGAGVGSSAQDVENLCGKPDTEVTPVNEHAPQQYGFLYQITDTGYILFSHEKDDVISQIGVTVDEKMLEGKGIISMQTSGSGSKVFDVSSVSADGYLQIEINGTGPFTLEATGQDGQSQVLLAKTAPYSGRIMAPDDPISKLSITTDGDWSISSRIETDASQQESFEGEADYVTPPLTTYPEKDWQVTYDGTGTFEVIWHGGMNAEQQTLVSVLGPYSGTLQPSSKYETGTFELLADGHWSLTKIQ